ncbi:MAG: hypothetical protein IKJ59_03260 [Clostridia bacterium]|nr:hypothetical protein [Clostridia bacterium]
MYKKTIMIFLIVIMITLCGCSSLGIKQALDLDEDLHIKFNYLENENIEFQGNEYYLSPMSFLWNGKETRTNLKYLGWVGERFFYHSNVLGNSTEPPVFLYVIETAETYFIKDYNYIDDEFLIEGTDDVICFGDDLLEIDCGIGIAPSPNVDIIISSVKYPELKAELSVFFSGVSWYAKSSGLQTFKLSDHFVSVLNENSLLF